MIKKAKLQLKKPSKPNKSVTSSLVLSFFYLGKTLGEGAFGKVRLGTHKYTN